MAGRNWTDAQLAAIQHREGALLVSAAAGSGKTAVLVERAVGMITREDAPVSADKLLIVTFTSAAAEELKSRIGSRLEDMIRADRGNLHLKKQRMLLKQAFIGTIDAYCLQFVRENFARLNVPPDIAVGDAGMLAQLSQAAIGEVMEEMYTVPAFAQFAALYGRARSDVPAQEAVLALYDFTQTLAAPEQALESYAAMYETGAPLRETTWGKTLLQYAKEALAAAGNLARQGLALARQDETLAFYQGIFEADLKGIEQAGRAAEQENWDEAYAVINRFAFAPLKPVRGCDRDPAEQLKAMRGLIKQSFEELKNHCFVCTQAEFEADRETAAPMVRALVEAAKLYGDKYLSAKMEEKILDFADFEHMALHLLSQEASRAKETGNAPPRRFEAVMVDEYQDTNELQDALYRSLAGDGENTLFCVGDVKQSIYRFRKADPGIFLAKKAVWKAYCADGEPSVLTLGHNFRSSKRVVEGVNYLFGMLMSRRLGEVEYRGGEGLICGQQNPPEGSFELRVLRDEDGAGDAGYVAARINGMVRAGLLVQDGEGKRRCRYDDFCILLRARTHMAAYREALEALGIPAVCDIPEEVIMTPEVLPLSATLAAIDNPGDDVNLAAAMMGPLFGFTADEMARLRAEDATGSLWGAVNLSGEAKAQKFAETLRGYRNLAGQMSAGRLCEELAERTDYLSALGAMQEGEARKENLLRFIGWAKDVSATGRGGLAGFVRLAQAGRGPAPAAAKGTAGHVNISTIHKSKGLEFPVCFLADSGWGFNTRDLAARVQMHAALGVGLSLREENTLYPTLPGLAIRRRRETESVSEEMRVLYVALTRAKERMVITYAGKSPEKLINTQKVQLGGGVPDPYLLSGMRSMGAWILTAALCHAGAAPLLACGSGEDKRSPLPETGFIMSVEDAVQPEKAEEKQFSLTAQPDAALCKQIAAGFAAVLPRQALSRVPRKVSVSALAKQGAPPVRKRPSFMFKSGLTAAEKGISQHSFMQYADLEAAGSDAEKEIERLVRQGYLSENEADAVDRQGVRTFFASPLAARLQNADSVLREYDFITAISAGQVESGLPEELQNERVLVQGIADAILIKNGEAEIVDYKTDHGKTAQEFVEAYRMQLHLYRRAIEKALEVPVTKLTIWPFNLAQEVDVPL